MNVLRSLQANSKKVKVTLSLITALLAVTFSVYLFLNIQQIAHRQIESVRQQTGFEITFSSVNYNPWNGCLALYDAVLKPGYGVSIAADDIYFTLSIASLWQEKVSISQITINKTTIRFDVKDSKQWGYLTDINKIAGVEKLLFKHGLLFVENGGEPYCLPNLPCHVVFNQLSIESVSSKVARVFASGHAGESNWCYNGRIKEAAFPMLKGEVEFDKVALKDVKDFLHEEDKSLQVEGLLAGSLFVCWDVASGVSVSGNLNVDSGHLSTPALSLKWANANIVSLHYSSARPLWQASELILGQAVISYEVDKLGELVESSKSAMPLVLKEVMAKNAQIEASGDGLFTGKVVSANCRIQPGEKSIAYYLEGMLPFHSGMITAKGVISGLDKRVHHGFELDINDLSTGEGYNPSKVGAYDLGKTHLNVYVRGQNENGWVNARARFSIKMQDSNQIPTSNGHVHRLVLALMMDSWGHIRASVSIPRVQVKKHLSELLIEALEHHWNGIGLSPYKYLADLDGDSSSLNTMVSFKAGNTCLDTGMLNNIERWVMVLKQRPALQVAIEGRASGNKDGAILFKRAGQRRLLKNSPDCEAVLKALADDRACHIMEALVHAGIEAERVKLMPSMIDEDGLVSRLIVEHFTLPASK